MRALRFTLIYCYLYDAGRCYYMFLRFSQVLTLYICVCVCVCVCVGGGRPLLTNVCTNQIRTLPLPPENINIPTFLKRCGRNRLITMSNV